MDWVFKTAAVILAGVAAYFLWRGNGDGAFIAGVIGAVAFFLSVRFQVRQRLTQREIEREIEWEAREEKSAKFGRLTDRRDDFVTADEQIENGSARENRL